jgi:hypothetical protein
MMARLKENQVRRFVIVSLVLASLCGAARAQEEIFSKHVQVFRPQGDFAQRLIKAVPASGGGWRLILDTRSGYRLRVPDGAEVDTTRAKDRILRVVLPGTETSPKPVFRIHAFKPGADDPTDVDVEYVTEYVDRYPEAAFNGRFTVTDSGLLALPEKVNLAMVGGSYLQGAGTIHRLEWAYLSKDQQLFLTFDCAEKDYAQYADRVARILLSFEPQARK